MTVNELRSQTRKDLAGLAKTRGVTGWHSMRKEELVAALSRLDRRNSRKNGKSRSSTVQNKKNGKSNGHSQRALEDPQDSATKPSASKRKTTANQEQNGAHGKGLLPKNLRYLASESNGDPSTVDRLFVVAHDAYWLHVLWELRPSTIQRAEAGLGYDWHNAKPVIRVLDLSADENRRSVEKVVKDVPIHGGVNHWYIEVSDPPGVYQLQIGYLTASGRFFSMIRSNIVQTPSPGDCGVLNENAAAEGQNGHASHSQRPRRGISGADVGELIDQQLRRPMSSHPLTNFLPGAGQVGDAGELELELDVEMVVYGKATPGAHLTVAEELVEMADDGTFTIRLQLPEGRQVVPATLTASNGAKQQTVVLAVERNTKQLEERHFDGADA